MSEKNKFDVIVIGGGPGGYPAAIRAAQMGKKVALIEAKELGGTCLNRGCIPSKTLIANAEVLHKIREAARFGIAVDNVSFDYEKMVNRKDEVVAKVRRGLESVISANGITLFRGFGKFISPKEIKITGQDQAILTAERFIIATGSEPRSIPAFPCDHEKILDSTDLLALKTLPQKLAIIGGGIIGCEFASLYAAFGVEVTIFEMMPSIIPMESTRVSAALTKAFHNQGIKILTNVAVKHVERHLDGVMIHLSDAQSYQADLALVAVGRLMNTSSIGLDKAGIPVLDNGLLQVNDHMETCVPGIYAVGDISSKWWLAHVASHQGLVAANNACGHKVRMHYNAVPSVIFTTPEIGTVGLTLEQAIEEGYAATLGAFPFQALGKSQASMETEGFAQIVIDKKTQQILGAQVVGHDAATLIAEMGLAIANELTLESITETIHAHPTIAEVWLESAFVANESPLHLPPKKTKVSHAANGKI